ncbi:hypothetical protein LUX57_20485 [Actinomadura madurae]|uniref:hypothetical protein n=1 Tax=Actinomadura madurae TaxID=1993 RepID=UPI0020D252AD|nr:hypothetical protein [Actinomadura madurae]MCP9967199.1 hypothetical protein [Actinomadura madurae]
MPVPDQRDPEVTRRRLTGWLDRHLPGVRIPHIETPQTSGFSNETLIFDAEWTDAAAPCAGSRSSPASPRPATRSSPSRGSRSSTG